MELTKIISDWADRTWDTWTENNAVEVDGEWLDQELKEIGYELIQDFLNACKENIDGN